MPRPVWVTNSLHGKKEQIQPQTPGKITMYSCGPTVYGLIHIGNLRAALTADLAFRAFKHAGYEVNYVRNYTDIDDKIIKRANEEGLSSDQVSKKYIQEVEKDYAFAGLEEPTHKTLVTDHLKEIVMMIQKLIDRGFAYVASDGEVIFEIAKFKDYGKLSRKNIEDLVAGARVEVSEKKRNPLDFALWKPAKPGEPAWDSPWCKGRPGWHIECSAMASKWLGDQIDVHHGGEDLIFPHHENEIAQSECSSGKAPYVRYWIHNGFLNIDGEKMSKSLGNFLTAREFLGRFSGEVARMLMFSAHYRSPMDFNEETIRQAVANLQRIYEAKKKALELVSRKYTGAPDRLTESVWGEFAAECEAARREIAQSYDQDLNTPGAFGALFKLIREFNRICGDVRAVGGAGAALGAGQLIEVIEREVGSVMGVGRGNPDSVLKDLERIRATMPTSSGSERPSTEEVQSLIAARIAARQEKNFAEADRIRKELDSRGVAIKDSPGGTTWEYK